MKRHFFLGLGANLGAKGIFRHTFARGSEKDREALRAYLEKKYGGEAILTKNGRTGLAIALKRLLRSGDEVLVNGFTCYAVYEALEAAGVRPVWADISPRDLNFTAETLKAALKQGSRVRAIIVQNSLGNPVEMEKIEKFAKRNGLMIIEDLAHSTGVKYPDGREAGTVGVATVLSFGKDKAIDTTSGGVVILRRDFERSGGSGADLTPDREPRLSDSLRGRFYPFLGAVTRGLSYFRLNGPFMRLMLKMRWIERSADNRLDFRTKIGKTEAKLALEQLKKLPRQGRRALRKFYLVENREQVLRELQGRGYYFGNFWYERPVAPERYYDEVGFPEAECPVATEVAQKIVNFPTYYSAEELLTAQQVVKKYTARGPVGTKSATGVRFEKANAKNGAATKELLTRQQNSEEGAGSSADSTEILAKISAKERKRWTEVVKKFPEANMLQSPEYAKMNEILGAKVIREDFGEQGWAVMIVRDAKRGRYLEIPCGPLIDWSDEKVVQRAIAKITEVAKREKCVFVRLRPQLLATPENQALLEGLGLRTSPMHLAAEHTVMIDLGPTPDELLAAMRRQTRYDVRKAGKLGIKVEKSNSEAIFREFHQVQLETAQRQNFVPPNLETLLAEREAFGDAATIYTAKTEAGEAIAYGLVLRSGEEGDYYEAASTPLNRKLPGADAVIWQAMQDLRDEGYQRFNLWGIAPEGEPHHRYAGVTTFKKGFGGEVIEYVLAHDLVISRARYLTNWVVETARRKRRHL